VSSEEYLIFSVESVEKILYPLTCKLFDKPDYAMPPLEWQDRDRMDAALNAIKNGYYEDVFEAAAALAYYVNKAHALRDGNKRMTLLVVYSFLLINSYVQTNALEYNRAVAFTEALAASENTKKDDVIRDIRLYFKETTRPLNAEEQKLLFGQQ
jgi:death-on-curing family protein